MLDLREDWEWAEPRFGAEAVYIHCRAGQERTAAVLCAYLGRQDGLSYDEALARLKQRRPRS